MLIRKRSCAFKTENHKKCASKKAEFLGNAMSHGGITSDLETRRLRSQSLSQLSILVSEQTQLEKPEDGSGIRNRIKNIIFCFSAWPGTFLFRQSSHSVKGGKWKLPKTDQHVTDQIIIWSKHLSNKINIQCSFVD